MSNAPAAANALDVLEHLSRHAEPVPAASVARDLGLPRSSVYHLLKVLAGRGYVTHYPEERRFGLGPAAYELGSAYQRQAPLARVARAASTGAAGTPTSPRWTDGTSSTCSRSARPGSRCS